MSAEDSRIPKGLERAIARLAKVTVEHNLDPAKVLGALMRLLEFRQKVWPTLTDAQKRAVIVSLRQLRNNGVPRVRKEESRRGEADNLRDKRKTRNRHRER